MIDACVSLEDATTELSCIDDLLRKYNTREEQRRNAVEEQRLRVLLHVT